MKRRLVIVIAILCAAVLTAPLGNSAEGQASHGARIQRAMNALVGAGAPGVIVLFHDGDQVIRLAAGYGELATRTRMRVADQFRIASLTKTFVSVVVLQLVGEGKNRAGKVPARFCEVSLVMKRALL